MSSAVEYAPPKEAQVIRPAEAARRLGVTRQYIHALLEGGQLKSETLHGVRFISEDELARFQQEAAARKEKAPEGA
jgi:predicted site-specific integrase-resolvase